MKRSVSAKDQLEDFSNEAYRNIWFQRIFLGSLFLLELRNVALRDVLPHKYYTVGRIIKLT